VRPQRQTRSRRSIASPVSSSPLQCRSSVSRFLSMKATTCAATSAGNVPSTSGGLVIVADTESASPSSVNFRPRATWTLGRSDRRGALGTLPVLGAIAARIGPGMIGEGRWSPAGFRLARRGVLLRTSARECNCRARTICPRRTGSPFPFVGPVPATPSRVAPR
jgi:hypothetical protein